MILLLATALIWGTTSGQSGRCSFPRRQETSGRIYMDGVDCTEYYHCDEAGKEHIIKPCKLGEVYNPWRNTCTPPDSTVNCKLDHQYYDKFDRLCNNVEEGNLPMPSDPRMYISCWQKAFRFPPMECPHGTIFNGMMSRCEHSDNRQYGQKVGSPPSGNRRSNNVPSYEMPTENDNVDKINNMPGYENNMNYGNQQPTMQSGRSQQDAETIRNNRNPGDVYPQVINAPSNVRDYNLENILQNGGQNNNRNPDPQGGRLDVPTVPSDLNPGGEDFIGHKAGDAKDYMMRNRMNGNRMEYQDSVKERPLENNRSVNNKNSVDPTTKGIDDYCIFDPFPGDCNKFVSCQDRTDIRNCGKGTLMSKSRHVCDYCQNLTDDEKRFCQVQC
ncbi:hypothetical protein LOTGIDRAFT_165919 [Lottia gigantea]|uniref:Chitin-binding type-2 domain-containing protein n=1 Tax=Lottia gigantea TaxID=225164 RepID=V4A4I8_LOTGI|nr:hypothetical protein LOTGIDRAFT_165919 [Lottia gigantea]ESO88176.1 hypothetical protein LOTGIDRAFT_165919 [Lottia gigantea]